MGRWDTKRELRKEVERRIGSVDDSDWDVLAPDYPSYDDQDLHQVVNELRNAGYGKKGTPERPVSEGAAVVRGMLVQKWEHVQTIVREFREQHFGAPSPPFGTLTAAARWIEDQGGQGGSLVRIVCIDPARLSELDRNAIGEGRPENLQAHAHHRLLTVDYLVEKDGPVHRAYARRGVLEALKRASSELARWWDIPQYQAVAYILVGARTYRDPLQVVMSVGSHPRVTLTIADPSITAERVADAYVKARKRIWGVKRGRRLSERDTALAEFVFDNPHLTTWHDRQKKWNKDHPGDWAFDETEAMRKAFERAMPNDL
ncbi:hypothetical protein ACFLT5_04140 [Chloroflexota bacterium]